MSSTNNQGMKIREMAESDQSLPPKTSSFSKTHDISLIKTSVALGKLHRTTKNPPTAKVAPIPRGIKRKTTEEGEDNPSSSSSIISNQYKALKLENEIQKKFLMELSTRVKILQKENDIMTRFIDDQKKVRWLLSILEHRDRILRRNTP